MYSLRQLKILFCGRYQLKQAKSYIDEHTNVNGGCTFECHVKAPDLLRVKIQSRHSNAIKHCLWIEWKKEEVTGWYCRCGVGVRGVGCCAHVAASIWYLSYARHNNYKPKNHQWWDLMDAAGVELVPEN
eukprot:Lithocolla_globosa_v1_NODE_3155_length_1748_cov_14.170112.p2 type:complete len:129 gc:universal NODE_3155_length_1748_cov_14.170112:965-1351(+)